MNYKILFFLLLPLAIASCSQKEKQEVSKETIAQVDQEVAQVMADFEAVGVSYVVVKNNEVIYRQAKGWKNRETEEALKLDDLFRIASISKSFSSTALMQLIEEGKIGLQDDVDDYLGFQVRNPNYPDTPITIKMMLSHTSSISDKNGYFRLSIIDPRENDEWQKSYNDYAPGSQYEYCNLCFNMLGAVVESLSEQRFDKAIKARILDPLGLKAGFNVDELNKDRFATIYYYDADENTYKPSPSAYASPQKYLQDYRIGYSAPVFSPTGGMKISAVDLAKYMRMHMNYGKYENGRLITEELSKTMQTPVLKSSKYGLALRVDEEVIPGERMVGHTGNAYGLYSAMFFEPEKKFGIVEITNGINITPVDGTNAFHKAMFEVLYRNFIQDSK
jgi:CubicO group peptidase (beta-lactamase class C family)